MNSNRRFEVVLFDLGNTLLYFHGDWEKTFLEAERGLLQNLQANGLRLGEAFLGNLRERLRIYYTEREHAYLELTSKLVLQQTLTDWGYHDFPDIMAEQALAAMYAITQKHWIPEQDALPTLAKLKNEGYRMALISNAADEINTQSLIDKLGGREYFEIIVISASAGIRKPNPTIFRTVLDIMQVSPEKSMMVGDTLNADILGARNAGIFSIWITRRAELHLQREAQGTNYSGCFHI